MTLTVTEKEHWKSRIVRRIDQAIQTLCASSDPHFLTQIKEDARNRAIKSLGLAELDKRITEITRQKEELIREENQTYRKMIAVLRRCDVSDVRDEKWASVSTVYPPHEVRTAIELRQGIHEEELLGENSMGKRILQLREEKEELLDTVWLATSGKQIKELWQKVTELLDQKPTPLQAKGRCAGFLGQSMCLFPITLRGGKSGPRDPQRSRADATLQLRSGSQLTLLI